MYDIYIYIYIYMVRLEIKFTIMRKGRQYQKIKLTCSTIMLTVSEMKLYCVRMKSTYDKGERSVWLFFFI